MPEAHLKSQSISPVNPAKQSSAHDAFMERRPFLQIPGPNPIIVRGGKGAWDEDVIEACDVLKDFETYYFYYHGVPKDQTKWGVLGYRVGLATASHPLGPWFKYGDHPVLDLGPKGSWEDKHVASAFVLKEKPGKFVMWYSGAGQSTPWSIGIATASKPEGPWLKYERNPVIPDFGYVGGVVKLNGTYYLYTESVQQLPITGPFRWRRLIHRKDLGRSGITTRRLPRAHREPGMMEDTPNPRLLTGMDCSIYSMEVPRNTNPAFSLGKV
jgi:hypothetical protein